MWDAAVFLFCVNTNLPRHYLLIVSSGEFFSSFKYEQGSQILSLKDGKNLAEIQAKELPKIGSLFAILKKATRPVIGAKLDPRGVGKKR